VEKTRSSKDSENPKCADLALFFCQALKGFLDTLNDKSLKVKF
jgi:hypothetical protein